MQIPFVVRSFVVRRAWQACAAVAALSAVALPAAAVAAPAAKPALSPKDTALLVLRGGIKSVDFVARGMAYEGLAKDKGNKEVKKVLEDGIMDPQWAVRAGVAKGFFGLGDARWKQVVTDALKLGPLSPLEVLPVLDDLGDKAAAEALLLALADKEHDFHARIIDAVVVRNRPYTAALFVSALGSKDPLVSGTAKKALGKLDAVLHDKVLLAIAKAQSGSDEIADLLLKGVEDTDVHTALPHLAALKPKDQALADKLLIKRALHGDRSVAKPLLALALRAQGKDKLTALAAFKRVATKEESQSVKPILSQSPTPDVQFAVYEILARAGDRSMAKEAEALAESTDVEVRPTGVFYLGWVGGAGRLAEMHGYLVDGVPGVRIAAARVLGYVASRVSVEPLKESVEAERDPAVRLELIKALTAIKDKSAYEQLLYFTREKDNEVRQLVVRALADSGEPTVRAGLQNALQDNLPRIRAEAVRGFILSDPAKAVDVWKRSLRWIPRGFQLELTRELGKSMEGYLELALLEPAKDAQSMLVREEALLALELLPAAQNNVLNKLIVTSDDEDLRVRVLTKLVALDKAKAGVHVKSLAISSGPRARMAAIRLLGKLKGDKEAQAKLVEYLNDADERIRIAAAVTYLGG